MSIQLQYAYRHGVLRSNDNNLIYVPILKNAHTWAENVLGVNFGCTISDLRGNSGLVKKYGLFLSKEKGCINYTNSVFLIILREPTSRWISAITQYLSEKNVDLDNEVQYDLIRDGLIFDNHARPQYIDLLDINLFNSVIFECNDNLQVNLNNFSKFWFNKPLEYMPPLNQYTEHDKKKMIYNKIKNHVNNDQQLKNRLKHIYGSDYNLYDTCHKMNMFFNDKIPDYVCALRQNMK